MAFDKRKAIYKRFGPVLECLKKDNYAFTPQIVVRPLQHQYIYPFFSAKNAKMPCIDADKYFAIPTMSRRYPSIYSRPYLSAWITINKSVKDPDYVKDLRDLQSEVPGRVRVKRSFARFFTRGVK